MNRIARSLRRATLLLVATLSAAAALLALPAVAATTGWVENQGARVRIVATPPNAEGVIRAAVDIELKPGWTTYWRDPGESGIPPQLGTQGSRNVASATLAFPAPVTLDEGGVTAIGYAKPVALPLTIRQAVPGADSLLRARLFMGVCKDICIPVSADFSLAIPAASRPESSIASVTVAEAYASLPKPESDDFTVRQVSLTKGGKDLLVSVHLPKEDVAGGVPQLFVAGPAGWSFAPARIEERREGGARFLVPVTGKPEGPPEHTRIIIVVRDGLRSIETTKALR